MGMQSRINLHAVSKSSSFLEGLESLVNKDNEIHLWRCWRNLNELLREFNSRDSSLQNNNVVFIDNLSLDKTETINLFRNFQSGFRLNKVKTIVYTGSCDAGYLTELKELKVNGILHDEETPLRESLRRYINKTQDLMQPKLNNIVVCKKFIDITNLVSSGTDCYDERVSAIISGHNWARREIESPTILDYNVFKVNYVEIDRSTIRLSLPLSAVKKKMKGLIVSAMPLIASAIMMLFPDDAISFDKKEFIDIKAWNPHALYFEDPGIDNYDLIILSDNNDNVIGETLLSLAPSGFNLPTKYKSRLAGNENSWSKIMLYTRSKDILYLRRLRDKSVLGLLHEESLAGAVKPLLEGNNFVDPSIENKIREYNKYLIAHPLSKLTYCQLKVLKEIAEEWKNRSITEKLYMTIDAVEKAKGRIEHALNIYSDELTHFAIENRDEIKYLLEFPLKEDTSLEKRNRKI